MKKNAKIIIGGEHTSLEINEIKSNSFTPKDSYDCQSLKNTVEILGNFNYEIELISFNDFITSNFSSNDLFIVTQWLWHKFKDETKYDFIKNKVKELVEQGNHFILMHHFALREDIFKKYLDIDYHKGNKRGWFKKKFQLNIKKQHPTLLNIGSFLKYNSTNLELDEFTYQFKDKSKFVTLVQKTHKTNDQIKFPNNFISFGYQKNKNSYIFLIDIHDIGDVEAHSFYFDILLNNTLFFLNGNSI